MVQFLKANPIWRENGPLFKTWNAKEPAAGQVLFPRVSPLCDHKGKLKGTSEKARGVPLIFLAPYFVNHISPRNSVSKLLAHWIKKKKPQKDEGYIIIALLLAPK